MESNNIKIPKNEFLFSETENPLQKYEGIIRNIRFHKLFCKYLQ